MSQLHWPKSVEHSSHTIRNINEIFDEQLTAGQRTADWVANTMGSWKFIIIQTTILVLWILLNITAWLQAWDPYPFILMNLVLSTQAAYAAPIIMMSQNRQSAKDRLETHNDYLLDQKAETEIRVIIEHLAAQDKALTQIHQMLLDMRANTSVQIGEENIDQADQQPKKSG